MSEITDMINQGFDSLHDQIPSQIESHAELADADDDTLTTDDEADTLLITDELSPAIATGRTDDFDFGRENLKDETERNFVVRDAANFREGEHVTAGGDQGAIVNITAGPAGRAHRVTVKKWRTA